MNGATTAFSLVERARQGDRAAFDALFARYRRRLAVLIHYKLPEEMRPAVDADDILQETLLRAFRGMDGFTYRGPGSFLAWLASIAGHAIIDAERYQGRARRDGGAPVRLRSASNPNGPEPVDTKTPSRVVARKQEAAAVVEKLNALPEPYRRVILMAKMEGLTTAEIAERMGKTREATAVLLHRALARLRELAGR